MFWLDALVNFFGLTGHHLCVVNSSKVVRGGKGF